MVNAVITPTRQQLAMIANGNMQLVLALEALFQAVSTGIPDTVTMAGDSGDSALAQVGVLVGQSADFADWIGYVDLAAQDALAQISSMAIAMSEQDNRLDEASNAAAQAWARANMADETDAERALIDAGSALAQANAAIAMF